MLVDQCGEEENRRASILTIQLGWLGAAGAMKCRSVGSGADGNDLGDQSENRLHATLWKHARDVQNPKLFCFKTQAQPCF